MVRFSAVACAAGAVAALGGGWLVGRWCLGLILIVLGGLVAAYGLWRDDGTAVPQVASLSQPKTVYDVLERARRSS